MHLIKNLLNKSSDQYEGGKSVQKINDSEKSENDIEIQ